MARWKASEGRAETAKRLGGTPPGKRLAGCPRPKSTRYVICLHMNFIVNSVEARDEDMFPSSSNRTFHYLLVLALLLLVGVPALSSASASTQNYNPGGLIIPLYSYPSSSWNVVIQDKLANPHVPVIAVVNPGNGPGVSHASPTTPRG